MKCKNCGFENSDKNNTTCPLCGNEMIETENNAENMPIFENKDDLKSSENTENVEFLENEFENINSQKKQHKKIKLSSLVAMAISPVVATVIFFSALVPTVKNTIIQQKQNLDTSIDTFKYTNDTKINVPVEIEFGNITLFSTKFFSDKNSEIHSEKSTVFFADIYYEITFKVNNTSSYTQNINFNDFTVKYTTKDVMTNAEPTEKNTVDLYYIEPHSTKYITLYYKVPAQAFDLEINYTYKSEKDNANYIYTFYDIIEEKYQDNGSSETFDCAFGEMKLKSITLNENRSKKNKNIYDFVFEVDNQTNRKIIFTNNDFTLVTNDIFTEDDYSYFEIDANTQKTITLSYEFYNKISDVTSIEIEYYHNKNILSDNSTIYQHSFKLI